MVERIKAFIGRGPGGSNASLQYFHVDYEEGENGCAYQNHVGHDEIRGVNFRGKLRAEQTMDHGKGILYRHPALPNSCVVKTFEKSRIKLPYHSNNSRHYFKLAVDFDSCFGCEASRMFQHYPTSKTWQGCDSFHLELYFYKSGMWFKYQYRKQGYGNISIGESYGD